MTTGLWQTDENADDYDEVRAYTVYVGGIEVNDHYLTITRASELAELWRSNGYDDVEIEQVLA